jgi:hypothetical protein
MTFTLVGFSEVTQNASLLPVAALADAHVTVSGDDISVPALNKIIGVMAWSPSMRAAQLFSPSLRRMYNFDLADFNVGASPLYTQAVNEDGKATYTVLTGDGYVDLRDNPLELDVAEKLNFLADNNDTSERTNCLVLFAAGTPEIVKGKIFTIKASSSTTLSAYQWTNGTLTFSQSLPSGRYSIVGMRAKSDGLLAARLVPVGETWRPGCIGVQAYNQKGLDIFRYGQLGSWAEFEFDSPPTIDFLSASNDTSEDVWLDLIQVRSGRGA